MSGRAATPPPPPARFRNHPRPRVGRPTSTCRPPRSATTTTRAPLEPHRPPARRVAALRRQHPRRHRRRHRHRGPLGRRPLRRGPRPGGGGGAARRPGGVGGQPRLRLGQRGAQRHSQAARRHPSRPPFRRSPRAISGTSPSVTPCQGAATRSTARGSRERPAAPRAPCPVPRWTAEWVGFSIRLAGRRGRRASSGSPARPSLQSSAARRANRQARWERRALATASRRYRPDDSHPQIASRSPRARPSPRPPPQRLHEERRPRAPAAAVAAARGHCSWSCGSGRTSTPLRLTPTMICGSSAPDGT